MDNKLKTKIKNQNNFLKLKFNKFQFKLTILKKY